MKAVLLAVLRFVALAIGFVVLLTLASGAMSPAEMLQRLTPGQVRQSTAALVVVSLLMTAMLAYLALRSRWHGWRLAGALFAIFYGLYALLGWIELWAFPAVLRQMLAGLTNGLLVAGIIVGAPFSLLAVWILGKARPDPTEASASERLHTPMSDWAWKIAASAVLYVMIYFTFGYYVAWRTPGLPEFYGGTDPGTFLGQLANVMRDTPWLLLLQVFRGLIWTGIGWLIVGMHKGRPWEVVLATGVAFTVLMNASLLFPNPFWPPVVARAHAIELVSSNLLYGMLLAALLLWHRAPQSLPIQRAASVHP